MIRILYAFHSGGNFKYVDQVLHSLGPGFSVLATRPKGFLEMDTSKFDVLVYQTFPDEHKPEKHNPRLVAELDKKFLAFSGLKILLDSFDWPEMDAYTRFNGAYPRIKHMAGVNYRRKFEVVFTFPLQLSKRRNPPPEVTRDVVVHCAFKTGVYPHRIRENILNVLRNEYFHVTSFERIPLKAYDKFLQRVRISVSADGTGASAATIQSMQAGAMLFVHEQAVNGVQLLPHVDLVDLEDYVTFNFQNLRERLNWLLVTPEVVDKIRLSGQQKFFEGYSVPKSVEQFRNYVHGVLGR